MLYKALSVFLLSMPLLQQGCGAKVNAGNDNDTTTPTTTKAPEESTSPNVTQPKNNTTKKTCQFSDSNYNLQTPPAHGVEHGTPLQATCKQGFTKNASETTLTCDADGGETSEPPCASNTNHVKQKCSFNDPDSHNLESQPASPVTDGKTVAATCTNGDATELTCPNGVEKVKPLCPYTCRFNDQKYNLQTPPANGVADGTSLQATCKQGFTKNGSETTLTCTNKVGTAHPPCESTGTVSPPTDCPFTDPKFNVMRPARPLQFGERDVPASCKNGFKTPNGQDPKLTCHVRGSESIFPLCVHRRTWFDPATNPQGNCVFINPSTHGIVELNQVKFAAWDGSDEWEITQEFCREKGKVPKHFKFIPKAGISISSSQCILGWIQKQSNFCTYQCAVGSKHSKVQKNETMHGATIDDAFCKLVMCGYTSTGCNARVKPNGPGKVDCELARNTVADFIDAEEEWLCEFTK